MSYNLILLNDYQKQYSKKFSVFIDIKENFPEGDIINFNFTPNFPFADRFLKELNEKTEIIVKGLFCTPKSAENIYTHTLDVLAEYLNPLDIGIIMDNSELEHIEKRYKRIAALNAYSYEFRDVPRNEIPSFEEWESWEWS